MDGRLNAWAKPADTIPVVRQIILSLVLALTLASCALAVDGATPDEPHHAHEAQPPPEPMPVRGPARIDNRPRYQGLDPTLPEYASLVALAKGETQVHETPDDLSTTTTMPWTTILGTVSVYAVVGDPVDGWLEVVLPTRPNGTTGWIRSEDVSLYVVEGQIVVDLSERTLTYYEHGKEMLRSTVAVGTSRNPTPTGHFYVTDSVTMGYEGSPWGPHALGLSARSDTITEYNGGDGIIGIHGTNRSDSIGKAASLGCVRLGNEAITALHEMVPIGTPVEIRA
jgi:hypothetical protein